MMVLGIISDERALKSKSPAMQAEALWQAGISGVYVPFPVVDGRIEAAIKGLSALGVAGVNVTVPYKETVLPFMDELSSEAEAIGAVNTIVNRNGRLTGHNTDAAGFGEALREAGFDPAGRRALIFGAGGAARAVVHELTRLGAVAIAVTGRDEARVRAAGLAGVEVRAVDSLLSMPAEAELIVNTSAVSSPEESQAWADLTARLAAESLELVFDINYGRENNFWRDLADRRGARFLDGLSMLSLQAQRSFELWTGLDLPAEVFRRGLGE